MNILKKVYCRIYQGAFRLALPILPYREPKIIKSCENIKGILREKKVNKVIIVTDKGIVNNGLLKNLESVLNNSKIKYTIYQDTNPNPTVNNVEDALNMYLENECQAIIAIGGGSAMDCAKALGARVVYPKKSVNKLGGKLKVWRKLPDLFAIPTTAGTGSETTLAAMITDPEHEHKYALMSFPLIPHYAVLDASFTYTLPSHLTATTGMDALTHAVEAYIGNSTTKETRALALEAVKLIFENIEVAYKDGKNHEARENMLLAAYKAGISFSKSYVGYIHALAHSLGGKYGTPHGLANAVLMPYILESYGKKIYKKLYKLGIAAGVVKDEDSLEKGALNFIEAIKTLNKNMNIPNKLEKIEKKDIESLAKHAEKEANPLYPVPVLMTSKDLEKIYYKVADWS